ncbi:hypothetical protein MJO28_005328 [Puccinia striiformis f. sp. tritici]|uniref:RING-type domain-containing protein n=2 Tax=Puccinia striiformis f. sp. tritici TaxID=168172 RepID=A0A0L0V0W9_9BASI|nr:hypothetical protein Pst134EB_010554 [Puccinia striiformis f. sp. tritici]KAI7954928.1 hypothetical protein MJO28_005328 [Puccinia striiformis f. sp. tritici]KAI7960297.1 hypothetical protein MJO29_005365 [Puccinia striiformis f. sp. tritici]KNE92932.1 hypothetical protein, variant [Puccinia striiformis f. sp. tritici PST-78]
MITTKVIVLPTCAICRDEEDEELNYVVTKCGHLFHSDCMKEWNRSERNRGAGSSRCPYCNTHIQANTDYYHGGDSNNMIRLHQLIKHRVTIIEDGKPTPEEEIKAARDNLNSIKVILNKEADKLRSTEAEKVKLETENKTLKSTVAKLTLDVKYGKERTDSRAADLRKEKESRKKDLANYSADKERFQKQITDAKHFYEKLRNERGELNKELGRKNAENAKLKGVMANQTGLISTLQAQSMQLSRERDQLVEKLHAIRQQQQQQPAGNHHGQLFRNNQGIQSNQQQHQQQQHLYPVQALQSNQHFYQSSPVEPIQSNQLIGVLQGLSGGFLKLEREYMDIKKLLEEKNDKVGNGHGHGKGKENQQIGAHHQSVEEEEEDYRSHQFSSSSRLSSYIDHPPIDSVYVKNQNDDIHALAHKMEALDTHSTRHSVASSDADQLIDPRLFG